MSFDWLITRKLAPNSVLPTDCTLPPNSVWRISNMPPSGRCAAQLADFRQVPSRAGNPTVAFALTGTTSNAELISRLRTTSAAIACTFV